MTKFVEVGGIEFDCDWYPEEGDDGSQYVVLETVYVGEVDISKVISSMWWSKIQDALSRKLEDDHIDARLDAELDRLEAWGV